MHKAKLAHRLKMVKKYLFWCVNEHVDFRVPELKSVAALFKIPIKWVEEPKEDPFMILEMDNEHDAQKIVSRCMLVRAGYELWGEGHTQSELHSSIKQQPQSFIAPHIAKDMSFSIRVEGFNKTLRTTYKLDQINSFSYLPFEGEVDLSNPVTRLNLIEYYGLDNTNVPDQPFRIFFGRCIGQGGRELIARYSLKQRSYIGSTSMDAQLSFIMSNLAQIQPASLVLDPFVGTGSVLVSAAHHGAYIWGSDIDFLTLHARTKPTRVKQVERGEHESIAANLEQYGLSNQYLDVGVVDCATTAWRNLPFLDAIITDPPYGIRESTARVGKDLNCPDNELTPQQKKLRRRQRLQHVRTQEIINHHADKAAANNEAIDGSEQCNNKSREQSNEPSNKISDNEEDDGTSSEEELSDSAKKVPSQSGMLVISSKRQDNRVLSDNPDLIHYPSKVSYGLCDVYRDLLNFAASNLVVGGTLVFWLPVFREDYKSDLVPHHPCLELLYNCEQILNTHSSRRLITLRKTRPPKGGECAEADVKALTDKFREKFFIASQMSRDERVARKTQFPRDKRGQGLTYRLADPSSCSSHSPYHRATDKLEHKTGSKHSSDNQRNYSNSVTDVSRTDLCNGDTTASRDTDFKSTKYLSNNTIYLQDLENKESLSTEVKAANAESQER